MSNGMDANQITEKKRNRWVTCFVVALLISAAVIVAVAIFGRTIVGMFSTAAKGSTGDSAGVRPAQAPERDAWPAGNYHDSLHTGTAAESVNSQKVPPVPPSSIPLNSNDIKHPKWLTRNAFEQVLQKPLSTFSIDVDTASYATMRRYLNSSRLPPKEMVRIEEFLNYFDYAYPSPTNERPFSITCEVAECPWQRDHKLLRVGLMARAVAEEKIPPNNLVFLVDISGSMNEDTKLPLLKQALKLLVKQMRDEDRMSLVVYANTSAVRLPPTTGENKQLILETIEALSADGLTAGGEGIQLAYKQATDHFLAKGNNRVILATDGNFNIGVSSEIELVRLIEEKRKTGVFLTVLGFGEEYDQDQKMKMLASHGNGNYAYIDSLMEARKVLMTEWAGNLAVVAQDVKIQIEFNPAFVDAYRLIGYESRMLKASDFNDDKVDAGELGAGQSVTAFYELIPSGQKAEVSSTDALKYQKTVLGGTPEMLTLKVRYKLPGVGQSVRADQPLVEQQITLDQPSEDFNFASAVAEFGLLLNNSDYKADASYESVLLRAKKSKGRDENGYRTEFIRLVEIAQLLKN